MCCTSLDKGEGEKVCRKKSTHLYTEYAAFCRLSIVILSTRVDKYWSSASNWSKLWQACSKGHDSTKQAVIPGPV